MLKVPYGFMFFEQVYRVGADGKLHIRKLAPRMPGSISQIQTAPDGGLIYIRQYASDYNFAPMVPYGSQIDVSLFGALQSPLIPVNRLIAHVNEKEGGNWFGRPWLRALYRSWLLKDRLLRVDAMKHERIRMGVPTSKRHRTQARGR